LDPIYSEIFIEANSQCINDPWCHKKSVTATLGIFGVVLSTAMDISNKVKGNPKYLYALTDDQTRFWIAQQASDNKYTSNIRPLLQNAKELANNKPDIFITDGAQNFHDAFTKEFFTIPVH
jgi:hypothetical protein